MDESPTCLLCGRRTAPNGYCFRCAQPNAPRLVLSFDGFRLSAKILGAGMEDLGSEEDMPPRPGNE